ncbi:MAG TPA: DUF4062 domain-containing protein [Pirellulaceae bacterium]|nr:DUF4062 domain-containing protein [Pirellulaceae bacterium]
MAGKKLKIMVASSVYGFETEVAQLCGVLTTYGYEVFNSHIGTIRKPAGVSNTRACLDAVAHSDLFFGIIRPYYGSGITHKEIKEAIRLDTPRWFVAHAYVTFLRQMFKQYRFNDDGTRKAIPSIIYRKTAVMDDLRVIDMYDDAIRADKPANERDWAQPYFHFNELLTYVETTFKDIQWIRQQCTGGKAS